VRELFTRRDPGHVCKQWPCSHAACLTRVSISLRNIDTAAVDSLKVLDPNRPIREADKRGRG